SGLPTGGPRPTINRQPPDSKGAGSPTEAARLTTNRKPPDEPEQFLTDAALPEATGRTRAASQPRRPLSFRGTKRHLAAWRLDLSSLLFPDTQPRLTIFGFVK